VPKAQDLYRLCCQSTKTIQEATLLHVLVTNTLDISITFDMKKSNTTEELMCLLADNMLYKNKH